jgi:hypothetical protein
MTNGRRAAIAAKIRALQAKTTAAGCTEQEALAAAGLAAKLMADYDIDLTEAEAKAEGAGATAKGAKTQDGSAWHPVCEVAVAIANFADCQCFRSNGTVKYVGLKHDQEMASWLHGMLQVTIDMVTLDWMLEQGGQPAQQASFSLGLTNRLSQRLNALAAERKLQAMDHGTGTALIVVKDQLVREWFEANNIVLRRSSSRRTRVDGAAYAAGKAAGDKVGLHRPLAANGGGTGAATAAITKRSGI